MARLVALVGVLIAAFGLAGLSAPKRVVGGTLSWQPRSRFYFAVVSGWVFGIALLIGASACRSPTIIFALGAIGVVAALILAPLGSSRVDSMFQWWLQRPPAVLRASFAAGIPSGLFLVYVGI